MLPNNSFANSGGTLLDAAGDDRIDFLTGQERGQDGFRVQTDFCIAGDGFDAHEIIVRDCRTAVNEKMTWTSLASLSKRHRQQQGWVLKEYQLAVRAD